MDKKVRVRFAPSPTGNIHIGNVRTAILNWLCARHSGGEFILRIEDTDAERSTQESEQGIIEQLNWLGLDWDEGPVKGGESGPYRQSERTHTYTEHVDRLIAEGKAYHCFCKPDEIDAEKGAALQNKINWKYSRKCLTLTDEEKADLRSEGKDSVVRFKVPDKTVILNDIVQGEITFDGATFSDFIIRRADGTSPYNFACVIDDALMNITHVIRGNDHVSNTPKQIMMYEAFGYDIPEFAHIPMITGQDGVRLAKRHGHSSVAEFREEGYLPQALINYLSLLSWSSESGDEVLSVDRLIQEFDLSRINKSPAAFDLVKLGWLNGVHFREL
ncbi:glutamate--tRNA ligase, partial [candidate division KSB1 bacterium]